jgi:hypothetical protein
LRFAVHTSSTAQILQAYSFQRFHLILLAITDFFFRHLPARWQKIPRFSFVEWLLPNVNVEIKLGSRSREDERKGKEQALCQK